jgi:hypothetical protein
MDSALLQAIGARLVKSGRLRTLDVDALISLSLDYLEIGRAQLNLSKLDVNSLKLLVELDPRGFIENGTIQLPHFAAKMREFMNLAPLMRNRLHRKLRKRRFLLGEQIPGRVYIEGVDTRRTFREISDLQDVAIERHNAYFEIISKLISTYNAYYIVPTIKSVAYDQFGLDWIVAEAQLHDGRKRYLPHTVADTSQMTAIVAAVTEILRENELVVFGGLQPVVRHERETEIVAGWREMVFPQIDIKILCRDPTDALQQFVDVLCVVHLIEALRRLGFSDEMIVIHINDHWGILGRLLERVGLTIIEIRGFRALFNELTRSELTSTKRTNVLERRLMRMLERHCEEGRLGRDEFAFLQSAVTNGVYDIRYVEKSHPEIANKLRRLRAGHEILQQLYADTGIRLTILPTIFNNEKDSGLSGQASISIGANENYYEVASFASNMAMLRRDGYYLASVALGILRLGTIISKHGLRQRDLPPICVERVRRAVLDYRASIDVRGIEQHVPFQQLYPGLTAGNDTA